MKRLILLFVLIALFLSAGAQPAQAANKMWWGSCRTGGGDCLDGIDGATLTAGDGALVVMDAGSTAPQTYVYRLYASSASESDPFVITPDTNPGTLRWHLTSMGEIYGYASWSAGGLIPDTCSGLLQQKSTNNQFDYLAFDGATDEYATFVWFPPDNWDRGTILAKFLWAASAAMTDAHTVIWGLAGYTVRDGDTLTKAITTGEQVISDAYATGDETGPLQKITAKTPAITIDGTHAVGNPVYFRVHRDADTDTSTVDAWLIGVRIQYTKTTETAW